ncbi:MAG TPA: AI-2E family transporter [Bacteroidales bacterium]|nr:AI-2E family transporter [Bacteroidales bacterium]
MNLIIKYSVSIISILLVGFFVWYFINIINYVLIAGVLSLIGNPLVDLLSRIRIKKFKPPRALWAAVVLILLWGLFIGFFSFFIPMLIHQANELSNIDVTLLIERLSKPVKELEVLLRNLHISDLENFNITEFISSKVVSIVGNIQVAEFLNMAVTALGDFAIAAFAISFILFFFLKEEKLFNHVLVGAIPPRFEVGFEKALHTIYFLLARYFVGLTIEVILIITLLALGLWALGLEGKIIFVIALLAGVLNVIPYIGPILGTLLALALATTSNLDMDFNNELVPLLIYMVMLFGAVHVIDNIVFQPLIYSSSVNAHPLEIFLVILMAGSLAGVLGMFLAIPGYTILRVISKEFFNQYKIVNQLTKNI